MFIPLWLYFLATGTLMAILTLIWAVRSRQFEEQDRARFIPLADLTAAELRASLPHTKTFTRFGLGMILLSGGVVILSTLAIVLRHV